MTSDGTASRPSRRRKQQTVDAAFVERVGLAYLNRFDATEVRFREMLARRIGKELEGQETALRADSDVVAQWVDTLVVRYVGSGLLSDSRYAELQADSLRRRGLSRRAITQRLQAQGIEPDVLATALGEVDTEGEASELGAARRFAKRRRLGHHRTPDQQGVRRQRDLAALARAGFSFEVALSALSVPDDGL